MINSKNLRHNQQIYRDFGNEEENLQWDNLYSYYFSSTEAKGSKRYSYIVRVDKEGLEIPEVEIYGARINEEPLKDFTEEIALRKPDEWSSIRYKFFDGRRVQYQRKSNAFNIIIGDGKEKVSATASVLQGTNTHEDKIFELAYYRALNKYCEKKIKDLEKERKKA